MVALQTTKTAQNSLLGCNDFGKSPCALSSTSSASCCSARYCCVVALAQNGDEAVAQNGDEAAPADQDLLETGQVEAAHSVQIPIVYTGGSKGIGSGTYHFNLPNQITESLAEKGELTNVRAYHGLLAQVRTA